MDDHLILCKQNIEFQGGNRREVQKLFIRKPHGTFRLYSFGKLNLKIRQMKRSHMHVYWTYTILFKEENPIFPLGMSRHCNTSSN